MNYQVPLGRAGTVCEIAVTQKLWKVSHYYATNWKTD